MRCTTSNPTGGTAAWTATDIDSRFSTGLLGGMSGVSCPSTSLCVAVDPNGNVLTSTRPSGGARAWTTTNLGLPPADTTAPAVSGTPTVGNVLSTSTGKWTGALAFVEQWQRCTRSCVNIKGATSRRYTLAADDAGAKVRVAVTAINAAGHASAVCPPSVGVAPSAKQLRSLLANRSRCHARLDRDATRRARGRDVPERARDLDRRARRLDAVRVRGASAGPGVRGRPDPLRPRRDRSWGPSRRRGRPPPRSSSRARTWPSTPTGSSRPAPTVDVRHRAPRGDRRGQRVRGGADVVRRCLDRVEAFTPGRLQDGTATIVVVCRAVGAPAAVS